jgi:ABC-type branched-subunit amino acid transport system ATPase component
MVASGSNSHTNTYGLLRIYRSFQIVTKKNEKIVFSFIVIFQFFLGLLDICSVILLGYASSLQFNKSLTESILLKNIFNLIFPDSFTQTRSDNILTIFALSFILLLIKTILTIYLTRYLLKRFTNIHRRISNSLFDNFIEQPLLFLQQKRISEINQVFSRGIEVLTIEIFAAMLIFLSDLLLVLMMIFLLIIVDVGLALSLALSFGISGGAIYLRSNKSARTSGTVASREVINSEELFGNTLKLFRELQTTQRTSYFRGRFEESRSKLSSAIESISLIPYVNKYAIEIGFVFAVFVMAIYQAVFLESENLVFKLVVFAVAGSRLLPAILRVQQGSFHVRSRIGLALPTVGYIEDFSVSQPKSRQSLSIAITKDLCLEESNSCIVFKNVSFHFEDTEFRINGVSFEILRGSKVGIVGASGSGKSTLIDLMLGVLRPDSGIILHNFPSDGNEFFSKIAYVPQDTILINGTIRENLLLEHQGRVFNDDDINLVMEKVGLSEFIASLSDGIDSRIGVSGLQVSGGQKQRIGLARALISDPEVLILDEATSALDLATEQVVREAVYLMGNPNRTIITVSHRIDNLKDSDQIIHLMENTLTVYGNWEEFENTKNSTNTY